MGMSYPDPEDTSLTREQLISVVEQQTNEIALLEGEVAGWRIKLSACEEKNKKFHDTLMKLEQEFVARGELAASPEDVAMYLRIARTALDVE